MQCDQSTPQGESKMSMVDTMQQVDEEHTHSQIKMNVHAVVQGHSYAMDSNMNIDMTWKGACPADMQPGDEKKADGTINRFSDQQQRQAARRGIQPLH